MMKTLEQKVCRNLVISRYVLLRIERVGGNVVIYFARVQLVGNHRRGKCLLWLSSRWRYLMTSSNIRIQWNPKKHHLEFCLLEIWGQKLLRHQIRYVINFYAGCQEINLAMKMIFVGLGYYSIYHFTFLYPLMIFWIVLIYNFYFFHLLLFFIVSCALFLICYETIVIALAIFAFSVTCYEQ
jgi:hypothetical protein